MNGLLWCAVPLGYLLGSVSSAVLLCRLRGLPDPRTVGSGNPGATNVLRAGDRTAAALTLLGDLLKGLLPVLAVRALGGDGWLIAATGLAAFLGHLYPLFFGFRGGKGVATALGVLLAVDALVAGIALAIWLAVAWVFRLSSAAALCAALAAPLAMWALQRPPALLALAGMLSTLLIWRHRRNIRNLLAGTEDRIGSRRQGDALEPAGDPAPPENLG